MDRTMNESHRNVAKNQYNRTEYLKFTNAVTWDCAQEQICLYASEEGKMSMHAHALCTPSLPPQCCMFSFPLNSPRPSPTATPENYHSYGQPTNPILRTSVHSRFPHNCHLGSCNSMNPSIGWWTGFLMEVGLSFLPHNQRSGVKSRQRSYCFKVVSSSGQVMHTFRKNRPQDIKVLVVGSTGYIGKFVVKELVKRGYNVTAIAREKSGIRGKIGKEKTLEELKGAQVCFAEVTDLLSLRRTMDDLGVSVDVVVSCLASRSGGVKDSWKIEYEATKNSLIVGKSAGASHFVLLSAICVQKPLLEFQRAKLKLEAELQRESENGELTYSIVRPTAFFKSLGGQVELVRTGKPYVMFGDGQLCACKPISEEDLASFIADCVTAEDKINKILPIGGPGKALTPLEQGEILFRIMGKEPKFLKVPIGIMDFAIGLLDFLVKFFPSLEDAAEYGKIGRYYASESMLVLDPETGEYDADATPSYGKDTLEDFFERVLREGMAGQELGEQAIF